MTRKFDWWPRPEKTMEDFAEARQKREEEQAAQVRLMEHQLDRLAVEGAQERQAGLEALGLWSGIDRSVAKKAETSFTPKSFESVRDDMYEAMKRNGITAEDLVIDPADFFDPRNS